MGYTKTSGLGYRGVWIDPNKDSVHYVWRLPWLEDIRADLISSDNPQGQITNSDLELAALVLQEAKFPFVSTNPTWQAPFTGSDNTPTVTWTFREAFTVNPVVSDLLRLRFLVNHHFNTTPSVFYHPGTKNTMADDVSQKFHLAPDIFLSLFFANY